MDKRFFLTIVLCFLAAYIWMTFVAPPPKPPVVPPATTSGENPSVQNAPAQNSGAQPNAVQPVGTNNGNTVGAAPTPDIPAPPTFPVEPRVLSNDLVEIEVNSMGATLTRVVLKEYKSEDLEQLLDLVSPRRMSGSALGLSFDGNHGVPWLVDGVPWQLEVDDAENRSVRYTLPLPDGRSLAKTYTLRPEEYIVDVAVEFLGAWPQHLEFSTFGPQRLRHDKNSRGIVNQCVFGVADVNERFAQAERRTVEKLVPPVTPRTGVSWGGLETNYFALVIRPVADSNGDRVNKLVLRQAPFDPEWAKTSIEQGIQGIPFEVGFGGALKSGQTYAFEVFFGPKDSDVLGNYDELGYGELIDYGSILGWLVWAFLLLLGFFHTITGSYGIAIILLTVVVKVLLHPINKKNQGVMMRQQKKMAKIQPQMQEIKERHKNDSLKANREIQKLLKENDVNPAQMFGGCLLMMLQLPIWIALISTFSLALDLRQESFLYIADLTLPDRLFNLPGGGFSLFVMDVSSFNLLPFLYVIMTLISQRMMPRSSDPQMQQQQKMMTFMMVMFGFIFYNFSSGLLLYFMTSAALGIVEQKIIRAELKAEGLG